MATRYSGVQGKNKAYHIVNKVQNQSICEWNLIRICIVLCVVFALYSSIVYKSFQNYPKFRGISLQVGDFGTFPKQPIFRLLGKNYLIHLVNLDLHRKSYKITKNLILSWKSDWWTHLFPDPELQNRSK